MCFLSMWIQASNMETSVRFLSTWNRSFQHRNILLSHGNIPYIYIFLNSRLPIFVTHSYGLLCVYLIPNMNFPCIFVRRVIAARAILANGKPARAHVHPPALSARPTAHGLLKSQLTSPTPRPTVSPHKIPTAAPSETKPARNHLLLCRPPSQTKPPLPLGLAADRSTPSSVAVVFR